MKIVVMGVSGSGKSTVGKELANHLNIAFYDADDFHPPENIEKMKSGTPLTDEDRRPWLEALASHLHHWPHAVLACSALKESYRQILQSKTDNLEWVYLDGSEQTILNRMSARENHFMKPEMLKSQLETLEIPSYGLSVSINHTLKEMIAMIQSHLNKNPEHD